MNLIANAFLFLLSPFAFFANMFKKRAVFQPSAQTQVITAFRRVRGGKFDAVEFWKAFDMALDTQDTQARVGYLITAFTCSGNLSTDVFEVIQALYGSLSFRLREANLTTWRNILDEFGAPQLTNNMWTLTVAEEKAHSHIQKILESRQVATA